MSPTNPSPVAARYADALRSRTFWVKAVVAGGMLAGFLLSPRLWSATRSYPLVPVADWLPPVPAPLDAVWFGALLLLLVVIFVLPRGRAVIGVFLGLGVLLALWDQNRWQPWFYQYLFMLAALAWPSRRPAAGEDEPGLNACRFFVAATYVWSGVQKLNAGFSGDVFPWLVRPVLAALHAEPPSEWVAAAAWGSAVLETLIGVGLIVRPLRRVAVPLAVAMHALLLIVLSPLGHNWNSVVWPWNVVMALLVLLLFGRTRNVTSWAVVWPGRSPVHAAAVVLMGVLPLLSFWELWDSYLSAALYSGNGLEAEVELAPTVSARLPTAARRHLYPGYLGPDRLSLLYWSMDEMNVPAYPARRVSRAVALSLLPLAEGPDDVVLVIQERRDWWTGKRQETRYDAAELAGP